MPKLWLKKANHRRGPRQERLARKKEKEEAEAAERAAKRQKTTDQQADGGGADNQWAGADIEEQQNVWYGMLDEKEQEYFKHADDMLELNKFEDAEERDLFVENVYKEVDGKELKVAHSQSCSRFMERLISLSNPAQLKKLFGKFSGHFLDMVQHRFASHCCETLFIKCAPTVTQELTAPIEDEQEAIMNGDVYVSMENLFLYALNELEGNLGFLLTQTFASHTLRVLVLVLSGQSLDKSETKSILASKKKEKIEVSGQDDVTDGLNLEQRAVPDSFKKALDKLITGSVHGLDTTYLRALATHPTGSPVLQAFLNIELTDKSKKRGKDQNSVFQKLIPDDPPAEETDSGKFINGLLYDQSGSRLIETILRHAPGKIFKSIYRTLIKDRMGSLARNETAGYVVMRALERLSREELEEALLSIKPELEKLFKLARNNVIITLIDCCVKRDLDTTRIAEELTKALGSQSTPQNKVEAAPLTTDIHPDRMHHFQKPEKAEESQQSLRLSKEQLRASHLGALLMRKMLEVPGPLSEIVYDGLLSKDAESLLILAQNVIASRVLQDALSLPTSSQAFRRQTIPKLYGSIAKLALDRVGSHVVDALWMGTHDTQFMRQNIARELAQNEASLRDSYLGRAVWRNWAMDLYKRDERGWKIQSKENLRTLMGVEAATNGVTGARERFAAEQAMKEKKAKKDKKAKKEMKDEGTMEVDEEVEPPVVERKTERKERRAKKEKNGKGELMELDKEVETSIVEEKVEKEKKSKKRKERNTDEVEGMEEKGTKKVKKEKKEKKEKKYKKKKSEDE
ncbi:MAG: Nucleolar protein 9 [Cirrosporium novae-zelandiae]|nr:MAG: Nucleolar protein 9 [Cirrosporium novae-zelandiae]